MTTRTSPLISLHRDYLAAQERCPHWDYENTDGAHEPCSRLLFATPDRLAADAARSRRVRMSVYEDNHGCHHPAGSYRLHLQSFLPCVHG